VPFHIVLQTAVGAPEVAARWESAGALLER
jgi:hypothetical protein